MSTSKLLVAAYMRSVACVLRAKMSQLSRWYSNTVEEFFT